MRRLISDWLSQSDTGLRRGVKPSVSQQLGARYQTNPGSYYENDRPFGIIVPDDRCDQDCGGDHEGSAPWTHAVGSGVIKIFS
ncbi:hypothetical protein AruPA_20240 [Acidiphilium sp. PA]|uniref:hypothetical protein n=1 Tax=Acidiphilium sp. PA TaxID=2871705 RepID=UPI002243B393|nr:hypothetical protein [Acidiphilium sp. PA]MCW8309356.1 hypothetical protein [Acidiphilium sp. PA]